VAIEPGAAEAWAVQVRMVFGALALMSLVLGLGLYLAAERLGLDEGTARLIATAFLIAGVFDAAVVYFWNRIFGRTD
jgi:hypothetical protein